MTALAKDPHQRFESVQAFAKALERVCSAEQHPLIKSYAGTLLYTYQVPPGKVLLFVGHQRVSARLWEMLQVR